MPDTFAATALMHSQAAITATSLEISFADVAGNQCTLSLTAELAATLSSVLRDFAKTAGCATGALTKKPDGFAVGTGKHEPVVLIRFEDDVPYGLAPGDAALLGHALLEQAELMRGKPCHVLQ